jgi:hypothetical protein
MSDSAADTLTHLCSADGTLPVPQPACSIAELRVVALGAGSSTAAAGAGSTQADRMLGIDELEQQREAQAVDEADASDAGAAGEGAAGEGGREAGGGAAGGGAAGEGGSAAGQQAAGRRYLPGSEVSIEVASCCGGLTIRARELEESPEPGQRAFVVKVEPLSVYITVFAAPTDTHIPNLFASDKLLRYLNGQWHGNLVFFTFMHPHRRGPQRRLMTNAGHTEGKIGKFKGRGGCWQCWRL